MAVAPVRLVACIVALAAVAPGGVAGHTRGVRPGRAAGKQQPSFPENATRVEAIERQFIEWVRYMGGLEHSTVHHALARAFPSYSLVVDKNPAFGDFTTIQAAVDSLPIINLVRVVIKVNAGTYTEKVNISPMRAFITLEGAGADKTIVQWGDTADSPSGRAGRPLGTYNSASFAVNAQYFLARNITFKVTNPPPQFCRGCMASFSSICGHGIEQNTSPVPKPGASGKQAVALRVSADNAAFVGCRFLGAQDTLYDHSGRHYYKECYIEGSVDFIFGNALSLFEDCHVHAIARDYGALTAQNRQSMLEDTGFSFVNCRVTGSGVLYLGRAWGTFSRVVFAYTYMDDIIIPRGWYNWGDPNRELTVFYGQYKCTGPGASFSGRVSWSRELTDEEARPFISLTFIDGTEWVRL
uniref:Pectinesterase n=1 Tax=Oryza meridionalis TaxID=40149 RepID=A0A0E0DZ51_9ORYZ